MSALFNQRKGHYEVTELFFFHSCTIILLIFEQRYLLLFAMSCRGRLLLFSLLVQAHHQINYYLNLIRFLLDFFSVLLVIIRTKFILGQRGVVKKRIPLVDLVRTS